MVNCKIRVLRTLDGVYPEYQPAIGKIYDADYSPRIIGRVGSMGSHAPFCVITVCDKRIVLRENEFEIVGGLEDGK